MTAFRFAVRPVCLPALAFVAACSASAGFDIDLDGGVTPPPVRRTAVQVAVDFPAITQPLRTFYAGLARRGYTHHVVQAVDPDGTFYFRSDVLAGRGYTQGPSQLVEAVREAKRAEVTVIAGLDVLGRRASGDTSVGEVLDDDEFTQVLEDLLMTDVTQIASGTFPARLDRKIQSAVQDIEGGQYVHLGDQADSRASLFVAQDFALYPRDESEATAFAGDLALLERRLGVQSLTHGHGGAAGRPVHAVGGAGWAADMPPGIERSLLRYRAVDSPPAGWGFHPGSPSAASAALAEDVAAFVESLRPTTANRSFRPACNLVILRTPGQSNDDRYRIATDEILTSLVETATAAISLAGYDLRVSYDRAATGDFAARYVIVGFNPDAEDDTAIDLPSDLAALVGGTTPLVVHPAGALPTGTGYDRLRDHLGVPAGADALTLQGLPGNVPYNGQPMRLRGFDIRGGGYRMLRLPVTSVSAEVSAPVAVDVMGEDIAVVLSRGSTHLVNLNILHLESAIAIAPLLREHGDALKAPFFGYVSASTTRTAAFAVDGATLVINPPGAAGSARVRIYDATGVLKSDELAEQVAPLSVPLLAREMVVIEP